MAQYLQRTPVDVVATPVLACISGEALVVFFVVYGAALLLFVSGTALFILGVVSAPVLALRRYRELVARACKRWRVARSPATLAGPYRAEARALRSERAQPGRKLKRAALFAIFSGDVLPATAPFACGALLALPAGLLQGAAVVAGSLLLGATGERLLLEPARAFRRALVAGAGLGALAAVLAIWCVSGAELGERASRLFGAGAARFLIGALALVSASAALFFFAAAREVRGRPLLHAQIRESRSNSPNRRRSVALAGVGFVLGTVLQVL